MSPEWLTAIGTIGGFVAAAITFFGGPRVVRGAIQWFADRDTKKRAAEEARKLKAEDARIALELERERAKNAMAQKQLELDAVRRTAAVDKDAKTETHLWARLTDLERKVESRDDTIAKLRIEQAKQAADLGIVRAAHEACEERSDGQDEIIEELQAQVGRQDATINTMSAILVHPANKDKIVVPRQARKSLSHPSGIPTQPGPQDASTSGVHGPVAGPVDDTRRDPEKT